MSEEIIYRFNTATESEVISHLFHCDRYYSPPLSERIEVNDYAAKIVSSSSRFEAWSSGVLVGLVAIYFNVQNEFAAYITNVSVQKEWTGRGVASSLIKQSIEKAKKLGTKRISLEVNSSNESAKSLYKKLGFVAEIKNNSGSNIYMILKLSKQ